MRSPVSPLRGGSLKQTHRILSPDHQYKSSPVISHSIPNTTGGVCLCLVCLYLCVSMCLYLCVSVSVCMSGVSVSVWVCVSMSDVSMSGVSVSVCVCVSMSDVSVSGGSGVSISVCVCVYVWCVYVCVHVHICLVCVL